MHGRMTSAIDAATLLLFLCAAVTGTRKVAGKTGGEGAQREVHPSDRWAQNLEGAHLAADGGAYGGESEEAVQVISAEEAQAFDREVYTGRQGTDYAHP